MFWHCRRPELPLSYWRIEDRPNIVEMARNFMCTSLLAILKDLAVFVWFGQDLMFEAALPVCSRMWLYVAFDVEETKWLFWCQQMPPQGTATNCTAFPIDVPRRRLWRRTFDLAKSLWPFFFDRVAFWVSNGILWQWERPRTILRQNFENDIWIMFLGLGFFFLTLWT